jgi:hypothetical protein
MRAIWQGYRRVCLGIETGLNTQSCISDRIVSYEYTGHEPAKEELFSTAAVHTRLLPRQASLVPLSKYVPKN